MFEKLSGDYIRGYTKAIMDLTEVFDYVEDDLNCHNKRITQKLVKQLFKVCLDNRENLRERKDSGFIRWNKQKQDFEWYNYQTKERNI